MDGTVDRATRVQELEELVAALDRRLPRVERLGEASIARAAAALRIDALMRIEELTGTQSRDSSPQETHGSE